MAILKQVFCTLIASYLCLLLGLLNTWPSSTIKLFKSVDTPLNRQMTEIEISLLGSLAAASSMISFPISGFLNDYWGRKNTCLLLPSLQLIAWCIVTWCKQVELILAAVFIGGFGGSIILVVPIYISEICQKSIRGTMGTFIVIFMSLGMIIAHVLGGYCDYTTMNYIYLTIILSGLTINIIFMKESPVYLMKKGAEMESANTVAYLRGLDTDSVEVKEELEYMKKILNPELDGALPEGDKLKPKKLSLCQFLKKSRSTRRALAVGLFLYTVMIFQGLAAIQMYARPLFEAAAPEVPTTFASVLLVLMILIASFIAAFLMDRLGRRILMISSSVGAGISGIVLGSQIHMQWGPQWLTPLFMYVYCLIYSCGSGIVPFIFVAEIFLPEVKSFLIMLATEWLFVCNFTVLFIFNPLISAIGLGPVFYVFAIICFATAIVTAFFMPETKGLTVDVIQTKFEKQW